MTATCSFLGSHFQNWLVIAFLGLRKMTGTWSPSWLVTKVGLEFIVSQGIAWPLNHYTKLAFSSFHFGINFHSLIFLYRSNCMVFQYLSSYTNLAQLLSLISLYFLFLKKRVTYCLQSLLKCQIYRGIVDGGLNPVALSFQYCTTYLP